MKRIAIAVLGLGLFLSLGWSQQGYTPAQENLENREWFQDAKFGLFAHWGVYSVMA